MKKGILIAVAAAVSLCGMAQKEITGEVLKQLQDGYREQLQSPQGASMRALHNAIGSNKLKSLALNHDNRADKNTYFNTSVKTVGITDQKSSGRCWLFTGLNVLRQKMIARHGYDTFEFSQIYLFFSGERWGHIYRSRRLGEQVWLGAERCDARKFPEQQHIGVQQTSEIKVAPVWHQSA